MTDQPSRMRVRNPRCWLLVALLAALALVLAAILVPDGDAKPATLTALDQATPEPDPSSASDPEVADPSPVPSESPQPTASPTPSRAVVHPAEARWPERDEPFFRECGAGHPSALYPRGERPAGFVVVNQITPGTSTVRAPGQTWSLDISVVNRGSAPVTFTETEAPRTEAYGDGLLTSNSAVRMGGAAADTGGWTQPTTHTIAVGERRLVRRVQVSSELCGGGRLPHVSFYLSGALITESGIWGPERAVFGWLVEPDGGPCFAEPLVQETPPVDGLELGPLSFHRIVPAEDQLGTIDPNEGFYVRTSITNRSSRDVTVTLAESPVTYLSRGGRVTGGWEYVASKPALVRRTFRAGTTTPVETTAMWMGCDFAQAQTPGARDVAVAFQTERDGVRYLWGHRVPGGVTVLAPRGLPSPDVAQEQ